MPSAWCLPAAAAGFVAALAVDRARSLWIVRRTRVLFITVVLLHAFSTGTSPFFPDLGLWSPTRDGVLAGVDQIARLVVSIALCVVFFSGSARDELVSGLYALARGASRLRFPAQRFAVRMALTLSYAESVAVESPRRWLELLREPVSGPLAERVALTDVAPGALDWCCAGAAIALAAAIMLR